MPKFEKTLTQLYATPIEACRGFLNELISFMEQGGVTITNKIDADTTTQAKTTFDITSPCQARIEYTCNISDYISMRVLSSNNTQLLNNSGYHYRLTLANKTQSNSQLVLVVTDDYISLWDKNGKYYYSSNTTNMQKINWLTAIKAKNLCTDTYDWFYSLAQYTSQTGKYLTSSTFYDSFGALGANGSIIPNIGYMNYYRNKSPFPTNGKYSIRPFEFYDTHIAVSTYSCYGMGDEIFSTFTNGSKNYYRDMMFLNEV